MPNKEKLQKIIAAYTPLHYTKIDLKVEIEDKYISTELKYNFCNDICRTWQNINGAQLRNEMFVTLRTGEDILKILQ
jgi:hypothetical protein